MQRAEGRFVGPSLKGPRGILEALVWNRRVLEGLVWNRRVMEALVWNGRMLEGLVWNGRVLEALVWNRSILETLVWNRRVLGVQQGMLSWTWSCTSRLCGASIPFWHRGVAEVWWVKEGCWWHRQH